MFEPPTPHLFILKGKFKPLGYLNPKKEKGVPHIMTKMTLIMDHDPFTNFIILYI